MIKKRKGFSLAEVLITLMIVGVVAAATIPTVTKRTTSHDKLWDWADYPLGSTYFAGSNVLLDGRQGSTTLPSIVNKETMVFSDFFPDVDENEISEADKTTLMGNFKPQDDKLVLVDNYMEGDIHRNYNSFISFYNIIDKGTNQYEYAGRLASDQYNLALGAGALERNSIGKFNTAIGHLVSMSMVESSHTTTLGRYNLIEFIDGHLYCDGGTCSSKKVTINSPYEINENISLDKYRPAYNVAIGNKAQNYNVRGIENTAVGYRALNGIDFMNNAGPDNPPNVNIGIGYESLGAPGSGGNPAQQGDDGKVRTYLSRNIGIGYRAGYDKRQLAIPSDITYQHPSPGNPVATAYNDQVMRLFLTNSEVQPFNSKINYNHALYGNSKIGGSEFDMSADEIIINTADGKHTILKIDLTGTPRKLPTYKSQDASKSACSGLTSDSDCSVVQDCYSEYDELGYCTGVGSDDLAKLKTNLKDSSALAEVCIAKFEDLVFVGIEEEKYSDKGLSSVLNLFLNKPDVKKYEDWDIFIKGLDVAYNGGEMTGSPEPAHIQTVKASLNYLDTWKEGQGVISNILDAILFNFGNFFAFFSGEEGGLNLSDVTTFSDLLEKAYQEFKDSASNILKEIKEGVTTVVENIKDFFGKFLSDARLKDVSGESTTGLKEINALKIKNYTYKADKNKTPHVGVIAQELQKVFPNSVIEGADGYLRIKQEEMFFAMVNAIQELDVQDKELKKQIPKVNKDIKAVVQKNKALISKNEKLKAENERLNAQLKLLEDKK